MKATITSYSYRQSDPPQVIVRYEREDDTSGSVDMYSTIKYNSTRRITAKYVDDLMSLATNQTVDTDNICDDILQLMARYIE